MTSRSTVLVTGIGIAIEDDRRCGWDAFDAELTAVGSGALPRLFDRHWGEGRRDDKVLSKEDRIVAQAAERAVGDAFGGALPRDCPWGAVSFTTSKLTLENECTLPFVGFRKPDHSPDTVAFRRAVDAAAIQIDPLGLLRRLDNNVCWWLCKTYGIGGINLQIGQCLNPDLWALVAAIDLVASGACDGVLVAGGETTEQSAVHLHEAEASSVEEGDRSVGGGALAFVLQSEQTAGTRGYARVGLDFTGDHRHVREWVSTSAGAPGLASALTLMRWSVGLRSAGQNRIGPVCLENC